MIYQAADCLIVGADFNGPVDWVRKRVLETAKHLAWTGIHLKIDAIGHACGHNLGFEIRRRGSKLFDDSKLSGTPKAMERYGELLKEVEPELLTVMCNAGVRSMQALKKALSNRTELVGVTVLTHQTGDEACASHGRSIRGAVSKFTEMALEAGLTRVVSAPGEIGTLRRKFGDNLFIYATNVRPEWAHIKDDDQNEGRAMSHIDAIKAGANGVIMSRPFTQSGDFHGSIQRALNEIEEALETR